MVFLVYNADMSNNDLSFTADLSRTLRSMPTRPPQHPTTATPHHFLFFLYIEPLSALLGSIYPFFLPSIYLHLTHPYFCSRYPPASP